MRLLQIIAFCFLVQVVVAQDDGKLIPLTTEMGGTVFATYEDAAIFLHGLTDAEADAYGNVTFFKGGSAGQRNAFRLSDVELEAKAYTAPTEYKGGELGPRVVITVKCKSGPCINDPLLPNSSMEESSFFITPIAKGTKVYTLLLVMQRFLRK